KPSARIRKAWRHSARMPSVRQCARPPARTRTRSCSSWICPVDPRLPPAHHRLASRSTYHHWARSPTTPPGTRASRIEASTGFWIGWTSSIAEGRQVDQQDALQVLRAQVLTPLRTAASSAPLAVSEGQFGPTERAHVVDTFLSVIEGAYVHLPQKRATYGRDPVQRLRVLRERVDSVDDQSFHDEMLKVTTDLRDAHTRYIGPRRLEGYVAVLPFLLEPFGPSEEVRFVVAKVVTFDQQQEEEFAARGFVVGVEVTYWNGTPIRRAVDLHAEHETGGRPDA